MARQPDYDVSVRDETTGRSGRVGAAWQNNGNINIQLNPCVTLTGDANLRIALFPRDKSPRAGNYESSHDLTDPNPPAKPLLKPAPSSKVRDEDIPF